MRNIEYLKQQLLDNCEVLDHVGSTLFTFRRHSKKALQVSDALIMDIGWPYHYLFNTREEFVEIPEWVNMIVDTRGDLSDIISRFRKSTRAYDLRLFRKFSYSYDLVDDKDSIDHFYERMYKPYVERIHGAGVILATKKEVTKKVNRGKLLRIHYQGQVLAAGVIYPEDDVLYFLWMGMSSALPMEYGESRSNDKMPDGVTSALYYFGIKYANELGMDAVDCTGTRSILSDGTFHFKRKWGAVVEDTFSPSSILLKLNPESENCLAFAKSTPLITRNANGLELRVVIDSPHSQNEREWLDEVWKRHGCGGIESICVIYVNDDLTETTIELDYNGISSFWVRTHSKHFPQAYCKSYSEGS